MCRRNFDLPQEDIDFLERMKLDWEAIREGSTQWLLIHDYELPCGYEQENVSVAFLIPNTYPNGALDMAFYYPHITRVDKKQINRANHLQHIDGKSWQRWSRHRTNENQWDPELDSILTHFELMDSWIKNELKK